MIILSIINNYDHILMEKSNVSVCLLLLLSGTQTFNHNLF